MKIRRTAWPGWPSWPCRWMTKRLVQSQQSRTDAKPPAERPPTQSPSPTHLPRDGGKKRFQLLDELRLLFPVRPEF